MNAPSSEPAKALFMKYRGNRFMMQREGELQTYQAFGVPLEQEAAWMRELQDDLLSQLERDSLPADIRLGHLSGYLDCCRTDFRGAGTVLGLVVKWERHLDSFSKLRIAEELLRTTEDVKSSLAETLPARRLARRLLEQVIAEPVEIAQEFRSSPHLPTTFDPTAIKERAFRNLHRCDIA